MFFDDDENKGRFFIFAQFIGMQMQLNQFMSEKLKPEGE